MATGYSGTIAGVVFVDGVIDEKKSTTPDDPQRVALGLRGYFRRHGFVIDDAGRVVRHEPDVDELPDPRDLGKDGDGREIAGTPLRDAAVDPKPEDFLPPSNAGHANPHGPEVVSPELHGSQGVRPVKPGPVSDAPQVQQTAETAHAEMAVGNELTVPARNASKALWVEFAIARGGDPDEVGALTRDELADRYRPEEG